MDGPVRITYRIELPPGVKPAQTTVQATLYYQALPPYYLNDRFGAAPNGAATQRLYYLASHVAFDGTPENPTDRVGRPRQLRTRFAIRRWWWYAIEEWSSSRRR